MRLAWIVHIFALLTIACLALSPVFAVAIAGTIAERNNCDLDEGSVHPCIVNGRDIGSDLYTLAMLGWFMIATIPLGAVMMAAYVLIVALYYLVRMILRRRRAAVGASIQKPAQQDTGAGFS